MAEDGMMKDLHVHESHSGDARESSVERCCRAAEERGIDELGFATHLIISGPDVALGISPEQIPEYFKEIEEAQTNTEAKLRIGLEVDYFPREESHLAKILDNHPFDYILGSLHYVQDMDVVSERGIEAFLRRRRNIKDALAYYYGQWRKAVQSGLFDVMAHPDYFRRGLHSLGRPSIPFEEYGSFVLEAIDSLKSYGVGIEVNSSGWRHGLRDCYPSIGFLKAAREAGIETVTIGSDSHKVDSIGGWLEEAVKRLEEAKYTHICVFQGRKNRRVSLSEMRMGRKLP